MTDAVPTKLSIDTLRGFACVLLVAFHVIGNTPDAGLRLPTEHVAHRVNEWLSLVRMPLFSMLSGFVYAYRPPLEGAIWPVLGKKVRRLLVPMLLVGTGFAVLRSVTPGTNPGSQPDWTLLHVVPVAHYWFLEALFLIFVVVMLLDRVGALANPWHMACAWIGAACLQLAAPLPFFFAMAGAAYLLPYFLLGVAAHRFYKPLTHAAVATGLLAVLVAALCALCAEPPTSFLRSIEKLVASTCCCLLLLRLRPQLGWLAWIGSAAFAIFLFHPVFTAATRMVLYQAHVTDVSALWVAGTSAGLAGSILLAMALRTLPIGHLLLGEERRPASSEQDSNFEAIAN